MSDKAVNVVQDEPPTLAQKIAAEALGTFVLVFFGCGTAVVTDANVVATGLAFGLAVLVMAYSVGRVSGGHFNPAVSVGAGLAGRLSWREVGIYAGTQVVAAIVAALALFILLQGFEGFDAEGAMGQNSFGDAGSGFAWWAAFLTEILLTAVFLYVILSVTDARQESALLAPLAIGLSLSLIHFVGIPLTGTSVNPARSIGPALFAGTDAIVQLWLFILAPLIGAAIAGFTYSLVFGRDADPVPGSGLTFPQRAAGATAATGVGATGAGAVGYGADRYQQQWNQEPAGPFGQQPGQPGQPGQQPGYPPAQTDGQQWGQPDPNQQWGQPQAPYQGGWGQPDPNQPPQQGWGQPDPQQQWGQPDPTQQPGQYPGPEEGQTQVRPSDPNS